jgi:hypothetical protein
MRKTLPLLTGLGLLALAALVHGYWTGRWQPSHALEEAAARVQDVPLSFGDWKGEEVKPDRASFARAGAVGYWMRVYKDGKSGSAVTVLLMCGRAGRMSVHTPDLCYGGAGYDVVGQQKRQTVTDARPPAAFWSARFRKPGPAGESQLRIHWGWSRDGAWEAPDRPRWNFAGAPFLYKLYVVRDVSGDGGGAERDASRRFLKAFLPELRKTLFAPSRPAAAEL